MKRAPVKLPVSQSRLSRDFHPARWIVPYPGRKTPYFCNVEPLVLVCIIAASMLLLVGSLFEHSTESEKLWQCYCCRSHGKMKNNEKLTESTGYQYRFQ